MTAIINASNTSGLTFTSDTSGNVAIQSNGTNAISTSGSNVTVAGTLTATGGVIQGANAAPAFSAYLGTNFDVTDNVITKVPCNTEEFDTASCYDNSTNYRFTPTVAGYYQVTVQCYYNTNGNRPTSFYNLIYKNGSAVKTNYLFATSSTLLGQAPLTALIYMNGTTDYLEFYARASGGTSQFFSSGATNTFFQAVMVRSA